MPVGHDDVVQEDIPMSIQVHEGEPTGGPPLRWSTVLPMLIILLLIVLSPLIFDLMRLLHLLPSGG